MTVLAVIVVVAVAGTLGYRLGLATSIARAADRIAAPTILDGNDDPARSTNTGHGQPTERTTP